MTIESHLNRFSEFLSFVFLEIESYLMKLSYYFADRNYSTHSLNSEWFSNSNTTGITTSIIARV